MDNKIAALKKTRKEIIKSFSDKTLEDKHIDREVKKNNLWQKY